MATNARENNSTAKRVLAFYGLKNAYSDHLRDQKSKTEQTR